MQIRTPRELGHLIRDRRKQLRLTQAALAARVGASRKWLIDLESGKRTAELSLVLRTLNVIGLDLDLRERSVPTRASSTDINAIVDQAKRSR